MARLGGRTATPWVLGAVLVLALLVGGNVLWQEVLRPPGPEECRDGSLEWQDTGFLDANAVGAWSADTVVVGRFDDADHVDVTREETLVTYVGYDADDYLITKLVVMDSDRGWFLTEEWTCW